MYIKPYQREYLQWFLKTKQSGQTKVLTSYLLILFLLNNNLVYLSFSPNIYYYLNYKKFKIWCQYVYLATMTWTGQEKKDATRSFGKVL